MRYIDADLFIKELNQIQNIVIDEVVKRDDPSHHAFLNTVKTVMTGVMVAVKKSTVEREN